MSRRGNCYDNALAENFFGILKTECIYRHKPETFEQANKMIDDYIYFYNHERILLKNKKRMDRRIKFICPFGLAEQQGFEPWHPFRGLRDFESLKLLDEAGPARLSLVAEGILVTSKKARHIAICRRKSAAFCEMTLEKAFFTRAVSGCISGVVVLDVR